MTQDNYMRFTFEQIVNYEMRFKISTGQVDLV